MKDHLTIADLGDGVYHIAWYLVEDQDFGAYVGETDRYGEDEPNRSKEPENWECWMADKVAAEDPYHLDDHIGFYWESASAAKKVITRINAAFKGERPLEAWEIKALDAGWKPPKKKRKK